MKLPDEDSIARTVLCGMAWIGRRATTDEILKEIRSYNGYDDADRAEIEEVLNTFHAIGEVTRNADGARLLCPIEESVFGYDR